MWMVEVGGRSVDGHVDVDVEVLVGVEVDVNVCGGRRTCEEEHRAIHTGQNFFRTSPVQRSFLQDFLLQGVATFAQEKIQSFMCFHLLGE